MTHRVARVARRSDLIKFSRREVLIPFFYKWKKYVQNNQYWKAVRAGQVASGADMGASFGMSGAQINLHTTLRQHWTENEILDVFYKYLGVRYTRFE